MKIKTVKKSYDEVLGLPKPEHRDPKVSMPLLRWAMKTAGAGDLKAVNFRWELSGLDRLPDEPCMVLMNHSSFVDLEMASNILYPKPFAIVCTSDGFVGKEWMMRQIGCIPTCKFVTDVSLLGKLRYCLDELGSSVLMYPEASYTFDGTATPLPRRLGVLLKRLGAPVIMIKTEGAFTRDPLYNNLQLRKVDVSADMYCLFSSDELKELPEEEIDRRLDEVFSFDNWRWQAENDVRVTEGFRADGLDRILFRCAECGAEGFMEGRGTRLVCSHCGAEYELDELGRLKKIKDGCAEGLEPEEWPRKGFEYVSDWYAWERSEIRKEIEDGSYLLDTEVRIGCMVDYKAIYMTGDGRLIHDGEGFRLYDAEGKLLYSQKPGASYGLYADYFWYEIGDMICIGDQDLLYYCFPKGKSMVAKARIAAEEMYKLRAEAKAARRAGRAKKDNKIPAGE